MNHTIIFQNKPYNLIEFKSRKKIKNKKKPSTIILVKEACPKIIAKMRNFRVSKRKLGIWNALSGGSIDLLANGEGYHGGLASDGLGLGDNISAEENGHHSSLLNRRGLLEAVVVDAAEQVVLDAHLVEAGHHLHLPRRLELQRLLRRAHSARVRPHHAGSANVRHGSIEGCCVAAFVCYFL